MIEKELSDYLLAKGCCAAVKAGKAIMDIYNSDVSLTINMKSNNTLVTQADKLSHEIIKKELGKTRIPLLSEEGRNMLFEERYGWDLYWLVDPLDGTREFIKKNGEFVVCVALMYQNRPCQGVIYVPVQQRLYFSTPDRQVYCIDDVSVLPREEVSLEELLVAARLIRRRHKRKDEEVVVTVTRSHLTQETRLMVDNLKAKYGNVRVIQCGSSLKFCYLAEGEADIYLRTTPLFDWDIAAGHAIIESLGYKIRHLSGAPLAYNKSELVIDPFIAGDEQFI
mgnify:CR=1 FL=1